MTNKKYNLIIVGPSNVGKSSIVKRYCNNTYQFTKPTTGMDIHQKFVRFNNETIHLEIRDTAGTEDYQSLTSSYRRAHGVIFVYDITDFDSSFKIDGWIKDIETLSNTNSVKILIGSKCDNETNRKISMKEGQRIAKVYRIPFFEVSSKTNLNIDKLFYTTISRIDDLQKQPIDINKELMHTNDTMKPKLELVNTTPVQFPKMKEEIPDVPSTEFNDSQHYRLKKVKPETTNKKYNLIIVGPSNVGKSSIVKRYCNNTYQFTKPTTGMDIHQKFVRFNNETIHLEIRDTAGTEDYQSLTSSYRGAHGVIFVYDITDFDSSFKIDGWIKDIETLSNTNSVKILIGSKCDNETNRKISMKEGQRIAKVYRIPFFEVSSKTNLNIDKLFYTTISRIDDLQKQPIDINKELMHTNDTMKPKLELVNTTPVQFPKMKEEIPDVPSTEFNDSQHYRLKKVKPETTNKKFKLIIVGQSNVGKTTIINHFCNGQYQDTVPTPGMDFHEIFVTFKNRTIQLNIWDTAGTEKYRSLAHSYYRGAQGVFIVYDITNLNSSLKLDDWIKDVENFSDLNAVKILIGNKCDDKSNRAISIEEGQKIAERFGTLFFEVSSKKNVNMDKLLYTMISKIHELEPEAQQTTNEVSITLMNRSLPLLEEEPSSNCSC